MPTIPDFAWPKCACGNFVEVRGYPKFGSHRSPFTKAIAICEFCNIGIFGDDPREALQAFATAKATKDGR